MIILYWLMVLSFYKLVNKKPELRFVGEPGLNIWIRVYMAFSGLYAETKVGQFRCRHLKILLTFRKGRIKPLVSAAVNLCFIAAMHWTKYVYHMKYRAQQKMPSNNNKLQSLVPTYELLWRTLVS